MCFKLNSANSDLVKLYCKRGTAVDTTLRNTYSNINKDIETALQDTKAPLYTKNETSM